MVNARTFTEVHIDCQMKEDATYNSCGKFVGS